MSNCVFCEFRPAKKKYCSLKCQRESEHFSFITRWLADKETGTRGKTNTSAHIKRYLIETRGSKCENCGWCKNHPVTNKIPIEIHHLDGHWDNNRPENLKLLCPNCHSLTPTFRNLNKSGGRIRLSSLVGERLACTQ